MNKKFFLTKSFALLMSLMFGLSACDTASNTEIPTVPNVSNNQTQNSSEKTETTEKTTESESANPSAGVCTNKYFPVSDGAIRRYKVVSSGKTDEYTYTVSYQNGSDKFSQTQDIKIGDETKLKIDWLCFPEGLRTAEYGQLTGNPRVGMKLESKGGSGITLPKDTDWAIGKKWISEYDLGGTFEMKPIKGNVAGKVTLNHEILNLEENVKTSAGEFTAAKVKTTISLKVTFQNKVLPSESVVVTNWYTPNVGLVKQEATGTLGKMTMDYLGN